MATCLHVLSEALPAGGLTAMVIRWIQNNHTGCVHSAALISQQSPIPDGLYQAIADTGGRVYVADQAHSPLQQAAWPRNWPET